MPVAIDHPVSAGFSLSLACLLCVSLAQAVSPPRPGHGPAPARIKGLWKPGQTAPPAQIRAILASEVLVEENALAPLPALPARFGLFRFNGNLPVPGRFPPPPYLDPAKVVSGGNTIAQVYPLGWGY